jgi:four helix bundle protein
MMQLAEPSAKYSSLRPRDRAVVKSYKDLLVWQKAMDLVVESYRISERLPRTETYGLASQIQRAAVSIPANIAEGHGRDHLGEYLYHLSIAKGSLMELETHLLLVNRRSYTSLTELEFAFSLTAEISRMLAGLSSKLRERLQSRD